MGKRPTTPSVGETGGGIALASLITLAILTRVVGLDQPIVENYVGRQVPTAMVARNLERGSGFFKPQIDVAPLPNLFLVEPPIFAGLAAVLSRVSGLQLEAAGRLVSALGIALSAWGLFGLVKHRDGVNAALVSVAVFISLPVTIRYGRSFQPDALMLGSLMAGARCWDHTEYDGGWGWVGAGFAFLSTGLALKVISAFVLIPLGAVVLRERRSWKLALLAATLLPALLWYAHAAWLIEAGLASKTSTDNGGIWLRVLVPSAWLHGALYRNLVWFFGVRAFTPLGPLLALMGLLAWKTENDRLWQIWGLSSLGTLALLAAKLHHEYYWLTLAPVVAVGVARTLRSVNRHGVRGKIVAGGSAVLMFGLAAALSATTWKTPQEWMSLRLAAREVQTHCLPPDVWVVAPEALLFEADRRGCRLEFTTTAAARAAGEWGERLEDGGPEALVEFYRREGARYFADVCPEPLEPARLALHDSVKRRYKVLVDRPGVLIASLNEWKDEAFHGNGTGQPADAPATLPARGDDP